MEIKLKATDYDYMGRGICYHLDRTYFIKNLIPGETAICVIEKEKKNLSFGYAKEKTIENYSLKRSNHKYEDITNLSHLNLEEQLYFQEMLTKKTLDKFKVNYKKIYKILYNDKSCYYRNKVTYHIDCKNYLKLANFEKESNNFISYKNIANPKKIEKIKNNLNEYLKNNNIKNKSILKIVYRINDQEKIMVVIYSLAKLDIPYNIFLNDKDIISIYNIYPKNIAKLYGEDFLEYQIDDIKYHVGPISFFQINTSIIPPMYKTIKKHIKADDKIIDAFSGVASISRYIKDATDNLIYAIEKDKTACDIAKKDILKDDKIKVINNDFFKVYSKYIKNANTIILDPPRAGLTNTCCSILNYSNICKIIYLSCNLPTLARDLKILEQNYLIEKVYPIKNFWQTSECETLAILKRK